MTFEKSCECAPAGSLPVSTTSEYSQQSIKITFLRSVNEIEILWCFNCLTYGKEITDFKSAIPNRSVKDSPQSFSLDLETLLKCNGKLFRSGDDQNVDSTCLSLNNILVRKPSLQTLEHFKTILIFNDFYANIIIRIINSLSLLMNRADLEIKLEIGPNLNQRNELKIE